MSDAATPPPLEPEPAGATTELPAPGPAPERKRRWLLPTLVGIGAFVLGIGVGGAVSSGGDPATTITDAASERPVQTSEPVADEPSPEPEFHEKGDSKL